MTEHDPHGEHDLGGHGTIGQWQQRAEALEATFDAARGELERGRELLEVIDRVPLADTQAARHQATATRAEVLERTLDRVAAALDA